MATTIDARQRSMLTGVQPMASVDGLSALLSTLTNTREARFTKGSETNAAMNETPKPPVICAMDTNIVYELKNGAYEVSDNTFLDYVPPYTFMVDPKTNSIFFKFGYGTIKQIACTVGG